MRLIEGNIINGDVLIEKTAGEYFYCDFTSHQYPEFFVDSDFYCEFFYRIEEFTILLSIISFVIFLNNDIIHQDNFTIQYLNGFDFYYQNDGIITRFNLKNGKQVMLTSSDPDIKYFFPNFILKKNKLFKRIEIDGDIILESINIKGTLVEVVLIPNEETIMSDEFFFVSRVNYNGAFAKYYFIDDYKKITNPIFFITMINGVKSIESELFREPIIYTSLCYSKYYGWFYLAPPGMIKIFDMNQSIDDHIFFPLMPNLNLGYIVKKVIDQKLFYTTHAFPCKLTCGTLNNGIYLSGINSLDGIIVRNSSYQNSALGKSIAFINNNYWVTFLYGDETLIFRFYIEPNVIGEDKITDSMIISNSNIVITFNDKVYKAKYQIISAEKIIISDAIFVRIE